MRAIPVLLTVAASAAAAFSVPPLPSLPSVPTPSSARSTIERGLFSAERERESLLRRLRKRITGTDPLGALQPGEYALPKGSAVVITGASDGLGREAAVELARAGFATILAVRDLAKGEEAARFVRSMASAAASVDVVQLDLGSVASVEAGADAILRLGASRPISGLLLNAGVWPSSLTRTDDGLEASLGVNHVGHFLLASRLLPSLRAASAASGAEARVVTVASSAHALAAGVESLDDPSWQSRRWSSAAAYGQSKLANVLYAQELARRETAAEQPSGARVTSLAVNPGAVGTSLFREFERSAPTSGAAGAPRLPRLPGAPQIPRSAAEVAKLASTTPLGLVLQTPSDGVRTLVYALLAPSLPSGSYLADCALTDVSPAAKDEGAAAALWEWTEEWLADKAGATGVADGAAGTAEAQPPAADSERVRRARARADDPAAAAAEQPRGATPPPARWARDPERWGRNGASE